MPDHSATGLFLVLNSFPSQLRLVMRAKGIMMEGENDWVMSWQSLRMFQMTLFQLDSIFLTRIERLSN
jgi:hypothetical protein